MAGPIAYYEVRWREISSDEEWTYMRLDPKSSTVTISGVNRNKTYVIQARSVGPTSLVSIWVDISHTVPGNVVPEVPANLTASPVADGVLLTWAFTRPITADIDVLIERATSASGPWAARGMVRATRTIVSERVNGTFYYRLRTKNYRGEMSAYSAIVSGDPETLAELNANIADALEEAINAAAIADGNINTFWQTTPPAGSHELGDIWFDIDDVSLDNPKVYRWRSTNTWTYSPNDALAQALIMANNAQTTADGKVKMFVGPTAPTSGMNPSDLWFNTLLKVLFRWDGFTWNNRISDVTLDQLGGNGINLMPDEYSTFQNITLPALTGANATRSRDPSLTVVPGSAGLRLAKVAAGESYVYLGNSYNIKHTKGKKYLISAYFDTNVDPRTIECYVQMSNGAHINLGTKIKTNPLMADSRLTWLADIRTRSEDGFRVRFDDQNGAAGSVYVIDGVMVEEQIGSLLQPSAYSRGSSSQQSLSALIAALSAQATIDGQVDFYRQSTAPAIGGANGAKFGDYWQDTDDNKWYICTGTQWIDATDTRLPKVIGDLLNTNGIVGTKTRLFYQEGQPTATANGDLWYKPSTKVTRYWNGSGWSLLADQTAAAADMLVLNPNFEGGAEHWTLQGGFYIEASTSAAISGNGLVRQPAANSSAQNNNYFPVTPFSQLLISSAVRALSGANGQVYIGFYFYDAANAFVDAKWATWANDSKAHEGSTWRTVSKKISVPAKAVSARGTITVHSHSAGYWCFDNIRAAYVDNVTEAPVGGQNLVPNSNFSSDEGLWPTAVGARVQGDYLTDNWFIHTLDAGFATNYIHAGMENRTGNAGLRQLFIGNVSGSLATGNHSFHCTANKKYTVNPLDKYVIDYTYRVDIGNARPANVNCNTYMGVWAYTKSGTLIGYYGVNETNISGIRSGQLVIQIPSNAATIVPLVGVDVINSGGTITCPWAIVHARFQEFKIRLQATMDEPVITDGTGWVKPRIEDHYQYGSLWRMGLRIKGSRHTLGGARNIRAAQVAGISTVRTAGALSATSAGVVSINAHSIELGGETVTYNAVASAITGLTQNVTYVIVTLDPYLDGGTRTYYAQTTVLSAQQIGEGAVVMGNITIPTSGSSGGGTPGTGGPGDFCVDAEMILPDGRKAKDILTGDVIRCWDENNDEPGSKFMQVQSNHVVGDQLSTRIVTESGAEVWASNTTPMPIRGKDEHVKITEMLGREVLVRTKDGKIVWEMVVICEPIGLRTVCFLRVHQHCYFAGRTWDHTIATHNTVYKP